MDKILDWFKENSGGILALMAIIGSVFGSAVYVVGEIRAVEDELRAEMRAIDGRLTASDAQLREEIRAGDAQLREDIRSLDAKMAASDVHLREDIRAGDTELRLALENLSNRILDILSGRVSESTRSALYVGGDGSG